MALVARRIAAADCQPCSNRSIYANPLQWRAEAGLDRRTDRQIDGRMLQQLQRPSSIYYAGSAKKIMATNNYQLTNQKVAVSIVKCPKISQFVYNHLVQYKYALNVLKHVTDQISWVKITHF